MADDENRPLVHAIDHYVVCTTDVTRWANFHTEALGAVTMPEPIEVQQRRGIFQTFARCRHGGFISKLPLPTSKGVGKGLPRYGHYIHAADIDRHLRRLDALAAEHSGPIRTSAEGEAGTIIYWQDPDGNQFDFWAPDIMPEGAMFECTPLGVGRISHGVFESRNLARTAEFFGRYCGLVSLPPSAATHDNLIFPLVAGGRLVFRKTDNLEGRTSGCGLPDPHTALVVRCEDFFPAYSRLWRELPEWDVDLRAGDAIQKPTELPARTALHVSAAGRQFKHLTRRGDDWFDWDTNLFHFYGGSPVGASLAIYDGHPVDYFSEQWERARGDIEALTQVRHP